MKSLYHITPRRNLESILKHGIIPAYSWGLSGIDKQKAVYLTDNPKYILITQAGNTWVSRYDPIIIKLNIANLEIKKKYSHHTGHPTICDHEYYYDGIIRLDVETDFEVLEIPKEWLNESRILAVARKNSMSLPSKSWF